MATVYLGLGSNLGDRRHHIEEAVKHLNLIGIEVLKVSSIIETDPVGGPPQGNFLNAVVKGITVHSPSELLRHIKKAEKDLGRVKTVKNGPRVIDIDILLYDELTLKSNELTIPHPRMFERAFVLKPLREIEPGLIEKISNAHR